MLFRSRAHVENADGDALQQATEGAAISRLEGREDGLATDGRGLALAHCHRQGVRLSGIQHVQFHFAIDALELDWLAATIDRLGAGNHWQHRARSALLDNLYTQQRRLAAAVVAERGPEEHPQPWIDAWLAHNHAAVERLAAVLTDLKSAPRVDSSMLMVALGEVGAVG